MLQAIQLHNFKCFEHLHIQLSSLNILSGLNGMGKSTVIQALIALRQTAESNHLYKGLILNSDRESLGTGRDVLYGSHAKDDESIGFCLQYNNISYNFNYNYADSDYLPLINEAAIDFENIEKENLFRQSFCYVSAERLGPRQIYDKSNYEINVCNQLGTHGEMTVGYLIERGSDSTGTASVRHPGKPDAKQISTQVDCWLSDISPNTMISLHDYSNAHRAGLGFRTASNYGYFDCNATNVGFGLSYVLPVIVALLKAEPGDLLIIENPEAHLHPAGQRRIGELIARCATAGVQVIIETHSDHLLNGIRLAVKHNLIHAVDVSLFYFSMETDSSRRIVASPKISPEGLLDIWPEGFFDEWDKAIDELFM